jgi:membrane protein DedA with SNARE-associated domain
VLESLLSTYGYPIIIMGTFLEGETIMVLGGVSAHLGYLSLDLVIICGFFETLLGDQLFFFLGRRHGKNMLSRRPSWQAPASRVFLLLERHQNLLILGFRFLYGIRSVTPFAIGMSNVSYLRFIVLNFIGAGIWAISIGLAGYYFGQVVESILGDIKQYEVEFMGTIVGVALLVWVVHLYRKRRLSHPDVVK